MKKGNYEHLIIDTAGRLIADESLMTQLEELSKKFNTAVFPGNQGGPLEHVIAAKGVAFGEALDSSFKVWLADQCLGDDPCSGNEIQNLRGLLQAIITKLCTCCA